MQYSLRTKLSLSYVVVSLLSVALLSLMTNFLLENQFQAYIVKQQEQKNRDLVNSVGRQFRVETNSWDRTVVENIGINALEQGLIVKVRDAAGNTVWDATVHNSGLCLQMIQSISQNMASHYPNFQGGYVETSYPVIHNDTEVGSVEIGYYGPFYLNDNDFAFISTLNRMLVGVGIFSLLLALLVGAYMAKRLSTPISRVIETARQIAKGCFDDRITEESSTKEIGQLTLTINDLAETLKKQETLRKRLTADVAHELRTPLATLQSHLEAMIDGIWKPETERLRSCHEEIMRMSRMVGDLEQLARFEGETLSLKKTRFDVSELIQHIRQTFETEFANKGVEIKFSGGEETIVADRDKISQVLVNLVSNALKYTSEGGTVAITVSGGEDAVAISLKDTGEGIPPEDLPFIFERFYRADKSRNRLTGGSGIGLAVVKAIVEAHGGRVMVRSAFKKGSEFIVTLPRQAD
jgi:two-component system sensor histidine kinase BaeS